jgi:hypothetical protein
MGSGILPFAFCILYFAFVLSAAVRTAASKPIRYNPRGNLAVRAAAG